METTALGFRMEISEVALAALRTEIISGRALRLPRPFSGLAIAIVDGKIVAGLERNDV